MDDWEEVNPSLFRHKDKSLLIQQASGRWILKVYGTDIRCGPFDSFSAGLRSHRDITEVQLPRESLAGEGENGQS